MAAVELPDQQTALDLKVMLERARRLDDDAAVRLQTFGTTLVVTVGILSRPTTLAVRAHLLPHPAETAVDTVVAAAALLDRLARLVGNTEDRSLTMPPVEVRAAWVGVSPPQHDWVHAADISVGELRRRASQGIAEVAAGVPDVAGSAAVTGLRERVWRRPLSEDLPAPAVLAFAADSMGFLGADDTESARVLQHGSWARLALRRGHCLTRDSLLG